jgi:hypothetical protein
MPWNSGNKQCPEDVRRGLPDTGDIRLDVPRCVDIRLDVPRSVDIRLDVPRSNIYRQFSGRSADLRQDIF